jgi:biotin carboxylase
MNDGYEDLNGKKLLVLAGAGVHCKVVEAAREMGIYTIVTDYLADSPAKLIADESLMYNIFDIDDLVEFCRTNRVDGVLNFCVDPAQRPAYRIATRLNVPAFGSSEQVHVLTNKKRFKEICLDNGVDVIPTYTVEDVGTNRVVFPVLVKPVDSRGSRGTSVCYTSEQLVKALPGAKAESSNGEVIIEKYMSDNQDLTISYLVKDGNPILVSIGDRYSGREEDNLNRQLVCTIQPSRYADLYMDFVNDKVVNMIKSIGIKNGPVFMQGFVDGDTVRMYDPGIRFPGNEYERIHNKATGMNLVKSVISYVCGGPILSYDGRLHGSYDLNGLCALQYMINVRAGKIATFDGLKEIADHPNVIDVQQRHFVGDMVENTGDVRHRAGEISILVNRDVEEIIEVIKFVQSKLRVLDEEGRNMLISAFDYAKVRPLYSAVYGRTRGV